MRVNRAGKAAAFFAAVGLAMALGAPGASAAFIDFEDEPPQNNDDTLDLAVRDLGFATATFTDFSQWSLPNHGIAPYGATGTPTIVFSAPVLVEEIWGWVSNSGQSTATITGKLGGNPVFTLVVGIDPNTQLPSKEVWRMTGSLNPVDRIDFTNYSDSHIDDLTINAVPEPMALGLLALGGLALLGRRRA